MPEDVKLVFRYGKGHTRWVRVSSRMSVILTAVPVGVAAGGASTAICSFVIICLA